MFRNIWCFPKSPQFNNGDDERLPPVEELHPDLVDPHRRFHPRVLCGNRLALWRLLSETEELPKEHLGSRNYKDKKVFEKQELPFLP